MDGISGNVTIPEDAAPTMLVGRYRVVRQLGQDGRPVPGFAGEEDGQNGR